MTRARSMTTLAALALTVLASSDGLAAFKQFAGAQCVRISGGSFAYYGGTIQNLSSSSTLNVMCPLIRDSAGLDGTQIYVYDRHPSQAVSCNVVAEAYSSGGLYSEFNTLASTGTGFQVMENWTDLSIGTAFYATCQVPPSSSGNVSHVATIITYPL